MFYKVQINSLFSLFTIKTLLKCSLLIIWLFPCDCKPFSKIYFLFIIFLKIYDGVFNLSKILKCQILAGRLISLQMVAIYSQQVNNNRNFWLLGRQFDKIFLRSLRSFLQELISLSWNVLTSMILLWSFHGVLMQKLWKW